MNYLNDEIDDTDEFANHSKKPTHRYNNVYMFNYQYPEINYDELVEIYYDTNGCKYYKHNVTNEIYVWHYYDYYYKGPYWTRSKNEKENDEGISDYYIQFPHKFIN
jgi:hypothetical protein